MVSARGRLFYICDEAPVSVGGRVPDRWRLVARDEAVPLVTGEVTVDLDGLAFKVYRADTPIPASSATSAGSGAAACAASAAMGAVSAGSAARAATQTLVPAGVVSLHQLQTGDALEQHLPL